MVNGHYEDDDIIGGPLYFVLPLGRVGFYFTMTHHGAIAKIIFLY